MPGIHMLEKLFHLQESGTNIKLEVIAGCTTFMTLSYIIFVQPAVLGAAGMDPSAVMAATCIASAIGTLLMAFLANYPIALAPAMGHNFYFAFTVCITLGVSWQHALGAVFIAGLLFILLSSVGLRETVIVVMPNALKNGIPVGIGLLIALVGLEWGGDCSQSSGNVCNTWKTLLSSRLALPVWFGCNCHAICP
jgi:AGZA family xanthine/uracil permease-like MFS transporter